MSRSATNQHVDYPSIAPDEELPFQREIFREYEAGNGHFFILHFNVHDYVFTETLATREGYRAMRLSRYLGTLLESRDFDVVLYYSVAGGLQFACESMRQTLLEAIPEDQRQRSRDYGQRTQEEVIPPRAESQVGLWHLYRILTWDPRYGEESDDGQLADVRVGVILKYLDAIAPHQDSLHRGPETSFNVEMLHQLSLDRRLRRRHLIIGLTEDLGQVASRLYAAGSECRVFRVDLPAEDVRSAGQEGRVQRQRSAWLEWVLETLTRPDLALEKPPILTEGDGGIPKLAGQTSGFSYDNLRDLVYYAARAGRPITGDVISQRKREVISAESRDLLEIVDPQHGFDMVAGYEWVKDYLKVIKEAILRRSSDPAVASIVPKGIMMLGPPGTGKSYLAASLAKETGFNMVKFRNIRSMWVGETERNLNRVLDLIRAMHPVIVFVDEVDAALGQRGPSVGGGGSGVERRIFQRILEFMAIDENRGRVLWIAASNRPDQIDAALISRFDMVIPFLLPDRDARRAMLVDCFPPKIGYTFTSEPEDRLQECIESSDGFSGRELDTVCRRAVQLSGRERLTSKPRAATAASAVPVVTADHLWSALNDFRQARDPLMYRYMSLLAIQATNFRDFLPPEEQLQRLLGDIWSEEDHDIDPNLLSEEIRRLEMELAANSWR